MVKIPGVDDLKKMGADLIDSAKSVKLGEMVDRLKTGVESITKKSPVVPQSSEEVKQLFTGIHAELEQLAEKHSQSLQALKKIQGQLIELAKAFDAHQPTEEKKP